MVVLPCFFTNAKLPSFGESSTSYCSPRTSLMELPGAMSEDGGKTTGGTLLKVPWYAKSYRKAQNLFERITVMLRMVNDNATATHRPTRVMYMASLKSI